MSSENPTQQVKDTVYSAATTSGEWAQQNVVNPVRSYVAGDKATDSEHKSSEDPTQQMKDTVYAAASTSGDWAQQNVVDPIRTYVSGDKNAEEGVFFLVFDLGRC